MSISVILVIGLVFGFLISYANLNKNNTIAGLSVLRDFTVAKTIMLVLGIGGALMVFEMMAGVSVYHVKPLYLFGTAAGGLIFGIGMSILGYCPGTLPISLGQGSMDALFGIIGGLIGGVLFTLLYPFIVPLMGENLGKETLFTLMGGDYSAGYIIVAMLISLVMVVGAFLLHRLDAKRGNSSMRWVVTGVGLAALNLILFSFGTPMGASTSYPYVADTLFGATQNVYYPRTISSGSWQIWFLLGAFLAGFIYSLLTGTFRLRLIYDLWAEYKGDSKRKRVVWSLIGGAVLIFGARLADGCTSGHIISGGMQFAVSSYLFAIFTFIGFLSTGYLFYTRSKK